MASISSLAAHLQTVALSGKVSTSSADQTVWTLKVDNVKVDMRGGFPLVLSTVLFTF